MLRLSNATKHRLQSTSVRFEEFGRLRAPPYQSQGAVGVILSVAVGGALGAVARHGMTAWVADATSGTFPWGTALVNVLGSFALGFALVAMATRPASDELRGFLTAGFLGAFTTFSTFSQEAVTLVQSGFYGRATVYVLGSVTLGLLGVIAGAALASSSIDAPT